MALGNLFGGLLSGWLYGLFAVDLNNPTMMWAIIAGLGFATSGGLYLFNKHYVDELKEQQQAQQEQVTT